MCAGKYNLEIFFVSFLVKGTCEGVFLLKLQAVFTNYNFTKDELFLQDFFFLFLTKIVDLSFLDGYFYLLLCFQRKKFY